MVALLLVVTAPIWVPLYLAYYGLALLGELFSGGGYFGRQTGPDNY